MARAEVVGYPPAQERVPRREPTCPPGAKDPLSEAVAPAGIFVFYDKTTSGLFANLCAEILLATARVRPVRLDPGRVFTRNSS